MGRHLGYQIQSVLDFEVLHSKRRSGLVPCRRGILRCLLALFLLFDVGLVLLLFLQCFLLERCDLLLHRCELSLLFFVNLCVSDFAQVLCRCAQFPRLPTIYERFDAARVAGKQDLAPGCARNVPDDAASDGLRVLHLEYQTWLLNSDRMTSAHSELIDFNRTVFSYQNAAFGLAFAQ